MTKSSDEFLPFLAAPRDFPDRAFQAVLKEPENLRELVQVAAPEQAPCLDCLNAKFRDPRFYMEDWRRLTADLLFDVPIIGASSESKARLAIVLVEQQTSSEDATVFRTSLHHNFAWAEDWKGWEERHERGEPLRLKPPIPIILYTGSTPWNAARELRELFDGPEAMLKQVESWKPWIWEVCRHTPQELLNMSGEWLKTLAVVRAEKEAYSRFAETMGETLERLEPLAKKAHVRWSGLVKFVMSWALNRRTREERAGLAELAVKRQRGVDERNEVQAMSQTIAESLIEEGEIKSKRADLQRLLKRKFPNKFDESAAARIQSTENTATLAEWMDALLDAESWKDFKKLAGWPKSNGDNGHDG